MNSSNRYFSDIGDTFGFANIEISFCVMSWSMTQLI